MRGLHSAEVQEARELRSVEAGTSPVRARIPLVDFLELALMAVLLIAAPVGAALAFGAGAALLTLSAVSLVILVLLRFGE